MRRLTHEIVFTICWLEGEKELSWLMGRLSDITCPKHRKVDCILCWCCFWCNGTPIFRSSLRGSCQVSLTDFTATTAPKKYCFPAPIFTAWLIPTLPVAPGLFNPLLDQLNGIPPIEKVLGEAVDLKGPTWWNTFVSMLKKSVCRILSGEFVGSLIQILWSVIKYL